MGTWGYRLYQNDMAESVRDYYIEQLRKGNLGINITNDMIEQSVEFDDDDKVVFWLALADTQWDLGRLEERVKDRALEYLKAGGDMERWRMESPDEASKRGKVLDKLMQKLTSPQPQEKKISNHRLYCCKWKIGDVYAYRLKSDIASEKGLNGRYFLLHKVGETTCYPGHIIPIVRVKISKGDKLPIDTLSFDALEYVQVQAVNYEDRFLPLDARIIEEQIAERSKLVYERDELGYLPVYRIALLNTSTRAIPKELIYVGNYQDVRSPDIEFVPHENINVQQYSWNQLENILIAKYCGYNLRQYEHYSK